MLFPWREDKTNACKRGEKSKWDCKYCGCLWCLLAAVLLALLSAGRALTGRCGTRSPGDLLFAREKPSLMLLSPLLGFSSTGSTLTLSALPDIAHTWKPCSLPLITVPANAVILQNVTITCLCYLQGGFILCLHLENALLADLYFSPWSIPSNLKNNSLIHSAVSSWQCKEEILPCVHALCMKCNYSTLNVIGALGSSCEEFSCILSDSKGGLIT